jgi:phospholipid N-methyltransferase
MAFLWAGLAKRGQTGSVLPSQRFLIDKMIAPVPQDYRGTLLELGSGTGALTLRLAERYHRARLLVCEINPRLAQITRARLAQAGILHRVDLVQESAEHTLASLEQRSCGEVRYIVSGLPLGNMGREKARFLIAAIRSALSPGGMYIQFQYLPLDAGKVREAFPLLRIAPVVLNLPPALVYYARKENLGPPP